MKKFVLTTTAVTYNKLTPPWIGTVDVSLFTSLKKAECYIDYIIDRAKERNDKIIDKMTILSTDENKKILYIIENEEGIRNLYFEISKQYTID